MEQKKVIDSNLKAITTTESTELKRRSWIVKHSSQGNFLFYFNFRYDLL